MHEPPIIFLDEPTSGVDPIARRDFWDLIYQLSAAGHTIFVTTHYMDEAEHCHRLALMYQGKIIALDTPASLKQALASHTLMELDSSDPVESLRVLEGVEGIAEVAVFGAGLHLTVPDPGTAVPRIRSLLAGISFLAFRRLKIYTHLRPSEYNVFSERTISSERPFRGPLKPSN